jgi:carboxyl-terminal processing protease
MVRGCPPCARVSARNHRNGDDKGTVFRLCLLIALLFTVQANAEPVAAGPGFDQALAANVTAAALAFMAPRTLEPILVSQLTVWGLRGISALDSQLTAELRDNTLRLAAPERILGTVPVPQSEDPTAWANAFAALSAIAWTASPTVRQSGTAGILQSFFDEMFNHLDPYSRYVPPGQAAEDRERRSGSAGLGVTLAGHAGAVTVRQAIDDGPGAQSGLRPGDRIVTVDGQSTRGHDATTVSSWIDGPEDTTVHIAWRGRDGRLREAEMVRAMVPPETVFAQQAGDLLLIRVTGFNRRTSDRVSRELEAAAGSTRPPDAVILDLRGNRGGLLREAVTVAGSLLPAGVVAVTAGRDPQANRMWDTEGGELVPNLPLVVLVDGRSASAAEVLAAALADRGRAVVIGSSTLGKGLVQAIDPLPNGGELFLTWSRILAPGRWPIQGLGVLPQVCTSLGQEALSRQLGALADGIQPMADALARHEAARAPVPPVQVLALRSACPAAEGRDGDMAAARAVIANPAIYAAALLPVSTGR